MITPPSSTSALPPASRAGPAFPGARPAGPVQAQADPALSPERLELREAAQAFEAIFVRQMLAAARASSLAEQTPFTGPGLEQFTAMRDESMADVAAEAGGFGLAAQIEAQLAAMVDLQRR